eukprot:TRINITY_DN4048_c0_g1_i2.p1 TRINITY_DN4048_c0_g1~~TRINITY_DN4048_c0_g1_i2.p1  ORF type:complete len:871 (+),score=163.08 TRINITY_DN4048_c0_g1_i2:99-2711(+)
MQLRARGPYYPSSLHTCCWLLALAFAGGHSAADSCAQSSALPAVGLGQQQQQCEQHLAEDLEEQMMLLQTNIRAQELSQVPSALVQQPVADVKGQAAPHGTCTGCLGCRLVDDRCSDLYQNRSHCVQANGTWCRHACSTFSGRLEGEALQDGEVSADSAEGCKTICSGSTSCTCYTFSPDQQKCWLKKKCGPLELTPHSGGAERATSGTCQSLDAEVVLEPVGLRAGCDDWRLLRVMAFDENGGTLPAVPAKPAVLSEELSLQLPINIYVPESVVRMAFASHCLGSYMARVKGLPDGRQAPAGEAAAVEWSNATWREDRGDLALAPASEPSQWAWNEFTVGGSSPTSGFSSFHALPGRGDKLPQEELQRALQETEEELCITTAIMLMGAVTSSMFMFYLVNFSDSDIQRYTWQTFGLAISIFTAVLIFQALHKCLKSVFPFEEEKLVALSMVVLLIWFVLMEVTTAVLSGVYPEDTTPEPKKVDRQFTGGFMKMSPQTHFSKQPLHVMDKEVRLTTKWDPENKYLPAMEECLKEKRIARHWLNREHDVACFSQLLAHCTCFAAIEAFGSFQMLLLKRGSSVCAAALAIPFAALCLSILFSASHWLRRSAIFADGKRSRAEDIWERAAIHAENDVLAFCLSYLTVTLLGMWLHDGKVVDEPFSFGGDYTTWTMVAVGLLYCLLSVIMGFALALVQHTMDMKPALVRMLWAGLEMDSTEGKIMIAICLTVFSMIYIYVLDKIADEYEAGSAIERAAIRCIVAATICIGFSWERTFDRAVEDLSEHIHGVTFQPQVIQLLISIAVVLVVVPAYRLHVLPSAEDHIERKRQADFNVEYQLQRSQSLTSFRRNSTSKIESSTSESGDEFEDSAKD